MIVQPAARAASHASRRSAHAEGSTPPVSAAAASRARTAWDGGAIVDATFRRATDADAFAAGVRTAPVWIVCEAPPEVLLERARLRALRGSISDAGPRIVAAELAVHRGRFMPPGPPLARLDTTNPVAELLDELAFMLDRRLEGRAAQPTQ